MAKPLDGSKIDAHTKVGTWKYWAPEIFNGKAYNFSADIWAYGVIAYELLTFPVTEKGFLPMQYWDTIENKKGDNSYSKEKLEIIDDLFFRKLLQNTLKYSSSKRMKIKEIVDYLNTYENYTTKELKEAKIEVFCHKESEKAINYIKECGKM